VRTHIKPVLCPCQQAQQAYHLRVILEGRPVLYRQTRFLGSLPHAVSLHDVHLFLLGVSPMNRVGQPDGKRVRVG
jgi:hypothetical protein